MVKVLFWIVKVISQYGVYSTPSVSFYSAYKIWSKSNYTKLNQIYIETMNIYNIKTIRYENTFRGAFDNVDFILSMFIFFNIKLVKFYKA